MEIFSAFFEKPKKIRFATQEPGERIIFVLRKAFVTNIPWIFVSVLALILPAFYMQYSLHSSKYFLGINRRLEVALIVTWYLLTLVYIVERYITWYFNIYIITDKRVIDIDFSPLFSKRISETTYDRVEDTSFSMNNLFHTIFNYGDVFLQTAAEKREFEFHSVPNPSLVQDKISDFAAMATK